MQGQILLHAQAQEMCDYISLRMAKQPQQQFVELFQSIKLAGSKQTCIFSHLANTDKLSRDLPAIPSKDVSETSDGSSETWCLSHTVLFPCRAHNYHTFPTSFIIAP